MTEQEFLETVAKLVEGLQVPVSMGMSLGTAREPWGKLHNLASGGWKNADEYVTAFRRVLRDAAAQAMTRADERDRLNQD